MTDMIFRIPSRTVQYGYVELPVGMQDGSSPELIAAAYVSYVYAFQKEEEATIARLLEGSSRPSEAPLAASQPEVDHPVDPVDKAAQMLAEGLGGATEIPEYKVGDKVTVGGIEFTKHSEAPWEQDLARKSKPWETDAKPERPELITEDW